MTFPTRAYKILTGPQQAELMARGTFEGAPIDVLDGYIHLSTAEQVAETLLKHFAGQDDLWIIAVDLIAAHDDLRWEPSRGGQLFPHVYGPLNLAAVVAMGPVEWLEGGAVRLPA